MEEILVPLELLAPPGSDRPPGPPGSPGNAGNAGSRGMIGADSVGTQC